MTDRIRDLFADGDEISGHEMDLRLLAYTTHMNKCFDHIQRSQQRIVTIAELAPPLTLPCNPEHSAIVLSMFRTMKRFGPTWIDSGKCMSTTVLRELKLAADVIMDVHANMVRANPSIQEDAMKEHKERARNFPKGAIASAFPWLIGYGVGAQVRDAKVRVDQLPQGGWGVFVEKEIKRDEIITTMPIHCVRVKHKHSMRSVKHHLSLSCLASDRFHCERRQTPRELNVAENRVAVFMDPLQHSPSCCGHLIRHSSYWGVKDGSANCTEHTLYGGAAVLVIANRPIFRGQELFL